MEPQIRAWRTWKRHQHCCQREEILPLSLSCSLSLNLDFSLFLSFILSPLAFPTSLFLSTLLGSFQECMCVTAVVSFLSENGGSKMSNTRQTLAETGAVWMCKEEKHYMLRGFFKGSTSRPLWLTSWGHGFALSLSLTHTYGSLMSHRSLHLPGTRYTVASKQTPS